MKAALATWSCRGGTYRVWYLTTTAALDSCATVVEEPLRRGTYLGWLFPGEAVEGYL